MRDRREDGCGERDKEGEMRDSEGRGGEVVKEKKEE
jgi:hypothetical protein